MTRYCDQCGAKIDGENPQFCNKCGAKISEIEPAQNTQSSKNGKIIIGLLIVIIALLVLMIFASGALDLRTQTNISFESTSPVTPQDDFKIRLEDSNGGIGGKEVKFTFTNDKNSYEFSVMTRQNGIASITPTVETGDYNVICTFDGDKDYKTSSAEKTVTVKQAEPDYESYSYTHSFEDTDKNGDGYVTLSDMNIAHTAKNIRDQMYADSDDDGDGKLNRHEYYKFMYKLNYDRPSYGLEDIKLP